MPIIVTSQSRFSYRIAGEQRPVTGLAMDWLAEVSNGNPRVAEVGIDAQRDYVRTACQKNA